MATEKFFVFNEDGALKRLKGRIVRFLDNEDPSGSDKSAIRTSLEVSPDAEGLVQADVGTAPNEIPVNGMLGSMAFQSAEGISVGQLEVTDKVDGSLGIGVNPISKFEVALAATPSSTTVNEVADFSDSARISHSGSSNTGDRLPLIFNVGVAGANGISAAIVGEREASGWNSALSFWTNNVTAGSEGTDAIQEAMRITSAKNLVMTGGGGIDFGSGATLDDYEEGTFTPTIYYQNPTGLSISYTNQTGYYTKIGNTVTVHAKVTWTVTGTPVNDNIGIQSFPFSFAATDLYLTCADSTGNSSVAQAGVSAYYAVAMSSSLTGNLADDIGSGSKTMIMSGTYQTTQ